LIWEFGAKGDNCEVVNAKRSFFNIDDKIIGCYYCEQTFPKNRQLNGLSMKD